MFHGRKAGKAETKEHIPKSEKYYLIFMDIACYSDNPWSFKSILFRQVLMKYALSYKVNKMRDQSCRDRKLGIVILVEETKRTFLYPYFNVTSMAAEFQRDWLCTRKHNINNATMSSIHIVLRQHCCFQWGLSLQEKRPIVIFISRVLFAGLKQSH